MRTLDKTISRFKITHSNQDLKFPKKLKSSKNGKIETGKFYSRQLFFDNYGRIELIQSSYGRIELIQSS